MSQFKIPLYFWSSQNLNKNRCFWHLSMCGMCCTSKACCSAQHLGTQKELRFTWTCMPSFIFCLVNWWITACILFIETRWCLIMGRKSLDFLTLPTMMHNKNYTPWTFMDISLPPEIRVKEPLEMICLWLHSPKERICSHRRLAELSSHMLDIPLGCTQKIWRIQRK